MLPNRMNEVVRAIVSAGVAALATITIRNATGTTSFNAGNSTIKVLGVSP